MKSNEEITALVEAVRTADEQRVNANRAFSSSIEAVEAAFRERAESLIEQLKARGEKPVTLQTRDTAVTGWVLLHHPATRVPLKSMSLPDGLMLVVGKRWKFWLIERGPAYHNPEIEVTYGIRELKTDSLAYGDLLWGLLQAASDTKQPDDQTQELS